jgi:hypothetical protein
MRLRRLAVCGVVVGGLTAPAAAAQRRTELLERPTPLSSQTPVRNAATRSPGSASLDLVKARCREAVDRRIALLKTMRTRVDAVKGLAEADRSALLSQIAAQSDDLVKLEEKIGGDPDLATLRVDCKAMVLQFRTYVLMEPKTRLLVAAARTATIAEKLGDLVGRLQLRIDEAKKAGKDVAGIQAALEAAEAKGEAAAGAARNASAAVVSLTPEGYPGNRATLLSARQTLKTAREDAIGAVKALKTVASGLRPLAAADQQKTQAPAS